MPAHEPHSHRGTEPTSGTRYQGSRAGAYFSPRTWLLPLLVLLLLGGAGSALYIGGLGSPESNLNHLPVAVVNRDQGAETPSGQENFGENITSTMEADFAKTDKIELRPLSWDDAQHQLRTGQVFAAVVVVEDFSEAAVSLVSSSLTDGAASRPEIMLYTNPLASPLASELAADAVEPALQQASISLGEQLEDTARQAQGAATERQSAELAEAGVPAQVQEQLAPKIDGTSAEVLRNPIQITEGAFQKPPNGAALGMGAFFYSVLLMVVGLSGSVTLHFLVDSRVGVLPVELGARYVLGPKLLPARWSVFLLKWGIAVVAGLPTAGLMMWVANAVGMPLPHGGWFFFSTWLSIVTVSAVTFALITIFGSAGMVLSLIYVVFMGLPAATGVVPLETLPGFFAFIARGEPLYQMTIANKAILYYDAEASAGLQAGLIGMGVIILIAVVLGLLFSVLYDRIRGVREAAADVGDAAARTA
ncbi:YhgE/Pip domain-containing protein [Arthrobacter koreensis]|uniref:YhgE/Pip domain-containing protein n=1 Tax=Arthrobacter koreensis TaxID=199136 RepID=UPI0036D8C41B